MKNVINYVSAAMFLIKGISFTEKNPDTKAKLTKVVDLLGQALEVMKCLT